MSNTHQDWQALARFASDNECPWARDPAQGGRNWGIHKNDPPPYNQLLGPVFARGPVSGVITQNGQTLFEFGEPDRPDMTFSVTKTYLALVAGIAFDQNLLSDLNEPVCARVKNIGFDDEHNRQVTWAQLMQFTSEWRGECFGIPDSVDHYRHAGFQPALAANTPAKGEIRPPQTPGTYWEYNDVRMNQFSLALMHLFERPLPEVFKEHIAQPLDLSDQWQWHGYENSWVTINGASMQSVPGGGHWGGGVQISARDQAAVGNLLINKGQLNNKQIVSEEWLRKMLTPCDIAPFYGYFMWLNRQSKIPNASSESFFALGVGGQVIWHDPTQNLVAALRWIDTTKTNDYIGLINQCL